jgi:hypothetical protein
MMQIRKLERDRWKGFFDLVSTGLVGKRVEVEVASMKLGDQIEAEWLPLLGIVYDPKSDAIFVTLEGLEHTIAHPRAVYGEEPALEIRSMAIVDADDVLHILLLRDPLMLPAPDAVSS